MKKKIRQRILLNFLSISLLGIILVTATGVYFAREATLQKHFESTGKLAEEVLHNIKNVYSNASRNVKVISQSPEIVRNLENSQTLKIELVKLKDLLGTYDDLTLLSPQGEVITSTDYNFNSGWKFREFFKGTVKESAPQVSSPYFLPDPLKYITSFTSPVLSDDGKVLAVVTAQLNMEEIQKLTDHVKLGDTGYCFLINHDQLYLSHPDTDKILKKCSEGIWKQLTAGSERLKIKRNDTDFIGNSHTSNNLYLSILRNKKEVLGSFNDIFINILIIGCLVAILAIILGNSFSRSITTPIEQLHEAIHRFTEGDSTARAEIISDDEIGELSEDFNKMVEEVTAFRNKLEELVKDRTEQLEIAMAAAEAANQAKSAFLANMSHEIRTPMNAIMGFTQILQQMEKDDEKQYFLASIITGGKTLLAIINDILDLSKLESGRFNITLSQISLKSILIDTLSILKNEARKKNLELTYEIDDKFPSIIICDEHRLRQVMINLVGNAIKFTDKGYVKIRTNWKYIDDINKYIDLEIQVCDSGIGVDESEQDEIFKEFVQSQNQGDKLYQGTGLGLAICKRLVTLLGGSLSIKSVLKKGSIFTIHFPKIEISDNVLIQDTFSGNLFHEFTDLQDSKIFIVDDNKSNLIFLQKFLSQLNCDVFIVENGHDALKYARERKPDVILMDLKMPGMDGFQTAEAMKSDPEIAKIPIIAVSASLVDEKESSFKNLFVSFLPKPVNTDLLLSELTALLKRKTTANELKEKA